MYWYGLSQYALKKAIQYTATSKAVSVAPGLAEVSGVARIFRKSYVSPYAKTECAYYFTELYKWEGSGKQRHRYLEKSLYSTDPIYVEDDTGRVLVKPTLKPIGNRVSIDLKEDTKGSDTLGVGFIGSLIGEKQHKTGSVYSFVSEYAPNLMKYDDKLEVHETYIKDGDSVYVLGTAKLFDEDKAQDMVIWDDPKSRYYCIADGSEKNALKKVSNIATMYLFGGPVIAFIGYYLTLVRFSAVSGDLVAAGVALLLVLYLWLIVTELVAMYNGLFQLKNNIIRAKANIDVLLKKRNDLIPELIEVVKAYADYEKELQTTISGLRDLPIGEANKTLIATVESYPDLKANENFMNLQKQLTKVEDQIAASRTFCNDSIKLYNGQIESFPYTLFAPRMGMRRIEFLDYES